MNFQNLGISAGIAGVIMGVLSGVPVLAFGNYFCGLWIWGLAIFSVWIYIRRTGPGLTMTNGQGAIVGAASGLVGSIVSFIITMLFFGVDFLLQEIGAETALQVFTAGFTLGLFATCGAWVLGPFLGAAGGRIGVEFWGKPHK